MPTQSDYVDAVSNGNHTADAVADACDISYGYACRVLKDLADDGALVRERDGNEWTYRVATREESYRTPAAEAAEDREFSDGADDDDGLMPVDRDYDWDGPMFDVDPAEYYASGSELVRLSSAVENRDVTGEPIRAVIDGPTGCGKTTLAEVIAAQQDAVWIEVQMSQNTTDADLLGSPSFAGGETRWVDGPITKALLASQDRDVVLLIDEVNRAPPHAKNALFAALDHRGAVRLDGPRGGEVIEGNPLNIIVMATMNQGDAYHATERMDLAEKTRYTSRISVDYLASDPADEQGIEQEAELMVRRTPVHADLARDMVETAAEIREMAKDQGNRRVNMGVPTRSILAWASRAYDHDAAGMDDPVVSAAEETIVQVIYGDVGMEDAYDEVLGVIEDNLTGVPFEKSAHEAWSDDKAVACADCDYIAPKSVADDAGVLAAAQCPDCGGDNVRVVENNAGGGPAGDGGDEPAGLGELFD